MKRLYSYVVLLVFGAIGWWLWTPDIDQAQLRRDYSYADSQFLRLASGTEIHYRDNGTHLGGARDGHVLLLVHGSNASLHTWQAWIDRLGDTYRVIALDLPGHGLTAATVEDDYSYRGMADAVHALVQHLDIDTFTLIGSSMGGGVSLDYAAQHPGRVRALVLVDSIGAPPDPAAEKSPTDRPLAFRILTTPILPTLFEHITPRLLVSDALRKSFSDQTYVTEAMIDRYWHLARHPDVRRATIKRFRGYIGGMGTFDLGAIAPPVLILWGQDDRVIPVGSAERLASGLADSRTIIYPGVGHLPQEEAADQSAADVRAFLSGL